MSTSTLSRNKTVLAAVVGAGVLIGAAGLYIYHAFDQRRKLKFLQQSVARLDLAMSDFHQELLDLRNTRSFNGSRQSLKSVRTNRSSSFSSSKSGYQTADDMYSDVDTDEDDDFYDLNFNSEEEALIEELKQKYSGVLKFFEEVDVLMKGNDDDRLNAFNLLKQREFELENTPDFLWRFAKAHQIQADVFGSQNDSESKKKYIVEGLKYASKALALDETNPDAHKWFAILTGMQGDFVSIKEKIQNGYLFQKHVLTALESKPNDYSLHYLLARFKFEVANISWLEKKIASSLFAEVPTLTYADAIPDLHAAEQLNPLPWKENRLLLAKCYAGEGQYDKAIEWLDSAKEITARTKEDETCDQEINTLIEKYKKYRKCATIN